MDNIDKDFIIDKAMTSVASFSAAAKMAKSALKKGGTAKNGMKTDEVLKHLIEFIENESSEIFDEYNKTIFLSSKKNVNL